MSNSMEQQMYYQHNPHNPTHSSGEPLQQQYFQMNGSLQQMPVSGPPTSAPNPANYGQQPVQYNQQYGAQPPMTNRLPSGKSATQLPPNYPQMSSSVGPPLRPQQLAQSSVGSEPLVPGINNLSQQMANISLSGSQGMQSQNGPQSQPSQQPMTVMTGQTYSAPQMGQNVRPMGGVLPPVQQQRPTHSMDPNIGQQSWSRPPIPGQPSATNLSQDNWNSSSVQSSMSSVRPPTQPPVPQQTNRFSQPYPGGPPPMPSQPQMPAMSQPSHMSGQQSSQQLPPPLMSGRFPGGPPMSGPQMGQQSIPPSGAPQGYDPNRGLAQQQYQQQPQRLDPEAMPSVVQVIEEDKLKFETNESLFTTSIPAAVPPLVTTINDNQNSVTNDGGCARPQHIRSTIYQVPNTEDTLKITNIPLAIVVQPFDDSEVDRKNMIPITGSEILRCNRCKAYMNPYMRFIDGGRRFQCSLCHHVSEVSPSYFANLDHTGQRLDKFNRPELFLGSYEFLATDEYCRNGVLNARRPHIIFAIELTATSKPIVHHLSKNLCEIIKSSLPRDPLRPESNPPLVGFLTYNSKIQIYDIINNGHSHIICDVSSTFPPLTTFLVDPLVHFEQIQNFLQTLPSLYSDEELETQTVLGPVIEAALMTAQVDVGNWFSQQNPNSTNSSIPVGKIYLFHCTLPNFGTDGETPGRLKPRWTTSPEEIRKLLGTDKEKTILSPDTNKYYVNLGQRCVTDFASGVELFLFPPINGSYLDVATLGELVRLTGTGAIYKYFNDFSDRFIVDLKFSLRSTFAFDAIMKVRTSTGIRAHDYIGNFYSRTTSDIECAAINAGNNIAVELKYDDKLPEDEFVVIQVAVLYTAISGERRVRVHNMGLSTCQQVADIYRNACCDTAINVLIRQAVSTLRNGDKTIQQTKEILINRAISILTAYRRHCAQPGSSLGQLILPEALKLLPMYVCGAIKCDAIDGGSEMTPDDKAFAQIKLIGASLSLSQVILYPKLVKIETDVNTGQLKATQIRCSSHKLLSSEAFAYVLENGFYILLYIPNIVMSGQNQFLSSLFGPHVDSVSKIQPELGLPKLDTNESLFLNKIIENIENIRKKSMRVYVIRQGIDKLEPIFKSFLYEDKKAVNNAIGGDGAKLEGPSYVDLLCHLHKEIRSQLN